jgi:hypothetical protein
MSSTNSGLLIQILDIIVWPSIILLAIFILKESIAKILNRFSTTHDLKMSIGSLSTQAKAMKEIHNSIDIGFKNSTLRKAEVKALIDTKIRSIQAAINYELTKSEIRNDPRTIETKKIMITNKNGDVFEGETLDVSGAGIGFKSKGRLQFQEIVQIGAVTDDSAAIPEMLNHLVIVRIEQSKEGFHYGASVPSFA